MDDTVRPSPKIKRQVQVRLEKLDADTVRRVARETGISVPYLLREAVQLLTRKHAPVETRPEPGRQP